MTDREKFEARIKADPRDDGTRKVFADWLDENGDHEEAVRQRDWAAVQKASWEWLDRLAKRIDNKTADELLSDAELYLHEGIAIADDSWGYQWVENAEWLEFWKHREIVTYRPPVERIIAGDPSPYVCPC